MVLRFGRFKLCDLRFHPYLVKVIERLPEDARKKILNNRNFQILTDEDLAKACVLRYKFNDPVNYLVYLNTNILKEPEPQVIRTIASEIARYLISDSEFDSGDKGIENLLVNWGFEKELQYSHENIAISKY